ncbi:hypothetical protein BH09SUM1_BH09SUM1_26870 [soil metagenome]
MSAEPIKKSALRETALESVHSGLVLRTKLRIAYNTIRNIRRHLYLHAAVGIFLMIILLGGGGAIFHFIFGWLMKQSVYGAPLMDRLVGMVLLIFFSMLLFSNLIITLSTTYLSKEVEFLMALPMSRQSIFRQKLFEGVIYSSWAFALLSCPLFISYGIVRHAPWYFYPLLVTLIIPFLLIPAAGGAIATIVVTAFLPARKTRSLCIALGIFSVASSVILARVTGIGRLLATASEQDFLQIMNAIGAGNSPVLPSSWLSNALQSIAPGDVADRNFGHFAYWTGMLIATALFLLEVCRALVPPLYYRGWTLSRDAAVKAVESNARFSPFRWIDARLEASLPSATAGLLSKDLKTFWRDPTQWTQLVILCGLMVIYVTNLGYSTRFGNTIQFVVNDWKLLLSYFNLAATCFILSILTTRFVYPMLSLEGRGFWTVGLAPIPRTRIMWQKFYLCLVLCICVAVPLMMLSNYVLQAKGSFVRESIVTVLFMCFGLTSLSVGIGALLPDFKEDNPARIANGIGGTFIVLISLVYISATVLLLVLRTVLIALEGAEHTAGGFGHFVAAHPAIVTLPMVLLAILQLATIILPMKIGMRRWDRLEF